jgi:small subunit ribosomal protein S17
MSGTEIVNQKEKTGVVVSDKMDGSIVVLIERRLKHPLYRKYINRSTKVMVHDPKNEASINDLVVIKSCRPISKRKNWALVSVKEKAEKIQ